MAAETRGRHARASDAVRPAPPLARRAGGAWLTALLAALLASGPWPALAELHPVGERAADPDVAASAPGGRARLLEGLSAREDPDLGARRAWDTGAAPAAPWRDSRAGDASAGVSIGVEVLSGRTGGLGPASARSAGPPELLDGLLAAEDPGLTDRRAMPISLSSGELALVIVFLIVLFPVGIILLIVFLLSD